MLSLISKLIFSLKKPKVVIVIGQERKTAKEAIFQVLKQYFKVGKDVFIFEAEEKEINKFAFYLKNSKLPVLVITDISQFSFVKNLPADTYFILNCDEEKIKGDIDDFDNLKTMKFGFNEKNDIFASDIKVNGGTNFKVNYSGKIVPFWLDGLLGKEQICAALAAISVGTILGLNLVEISQALKEK